MLPSSVPDLHRHREPHPDADRADELISRIRKEPWLVEAMEAVAASGLPDAWIGAGAVRDVVWGQLHGGFDPATVKDVDVAFYDPADLTRERDEAADRRLAGLLDRRWEATNQAAVHRWFAEYFGGRDVPPLRSVHEAIGTWPETATCVAVRATPAGVDVCAPHGLADLLDGVWRRNPARVTAEQSAARLRRQADRWPQLTVIPPAP